MWLATLAHAAAPDVRKASGCGFLFLCPSPVGRGEINSTLLRTLADKDVRASADSLCLRTFVVNLYDMKPRPLLLSVLISLLVLFCFSFAIPIGAQRPVQSKGQ